LGWCFSFQVYAYSPYFLLSKSLPVYAKDHRLHASRSRYRTRKVLKREMSGIQRIGDPGIPGGTVSSKVASTPSTAPRPFSIALGWIQPNAELGPRDGERLRVHCRQIHSRYQIIREFHACSMLARQDPLLQMHLLKHHELILQPMNSCSRNM